MKCEFNSQSTGISACGTLCFASLHMLETENRNIGLLREQRSYTANSGLICSSASWTFQICLPWLLCMRLSSIQV